MGTEGEASTKAKAEQRVKGAHLRTCEAEQARALQPALTPLTALAEEAEAERLRKAKGKDKAVEPAEEGEDDGDEDDEDVVRPCAVSHYTCIVCVCATAARGALVGSVQRVHRWSTPANASLL